MATLMEIQASIERELSPPPPPVKQVDMSADELRGYLQEVAGNVSILLDDLEYKITTRDEMLRFLRWAKVWKMRWKAEAPDCDDFTRKLKGALVCKGWWCSQHWIAGFR